jgi:hypothetical protein
VILFLETTATQIRCQAIIHHDRVTGKDCLLFSFVFNNLHCDLESISWEWFRDHDAAENEPVRSAGFSLALLMCSALRFGSLNSLGCRVALFLAISQGSPPLYGRAERHALPPTSVTIRLYDQVPLEIARKLEFSDKTS